LRASVTHRFGVEEPPSDRDLIAYLDGLAIADMALASACRLGHERAWDHFVKEFRPGLYAAARAIAGDAGRELADSVYADLFGISPDRPDRRSLLAYFHGRSQLLTWLRAVLARRHVDRFREAARFEPLPDDEHGRTVGSIPTPDPVATDPRRSEYVRRTQIALDATITSLPPDDRLRLRLYYGENLTLAQIGRVMREHEATVSRKLERARRHLRSSIERALRDDHGLDEATVAACFEHAATAPELQLTQLLTPADEGRSR
jgi:RNA polymerase sigma-70 factor (ECF subfamily)